MQSIFLCVGKVIAERQITILREEGAMLRKDGETNGHFIALEEISECKYELNKKLGRGSSRGKSHE